MAAHVGRVDAAVLVGIGAAFDFSAGLKRKAPRWDATLWPRGRSACCPSRRLLARHIVNNPGFVALLVRQYLEIDQAIFLGIPSTVARASRYVCDGVMRPSLAGVNAA